jgi:hypothetical protein
MYIYVYMYTHVYVMLCLCVMHICIYMLNVCYVSTYERECHDHIVADDLLGAHPPTLHYILGKMVNG